MANGQAATPEQSQRFQHGWIRVPSGDLKPVVRAAEFGEARILPYRYHKSIRRALHQALPRFRRFVIVGYSVPAADTRLTFTNCFRRRSCETTRSWWS